MVTINHPDSARGRFLILVNRSQTLFLLFPPLLGVPSPAAVTARKCVMGRAPTTPLLQTTPLLYGIHVDESVEESIFHFRREDTPANTPVKVIMSSDWKMGVALIRPVRAPSWNVSDS